MKRLIFFVVFVLFTGGNSIVISLAGDRDTGNEVNMPIGDGEENPGEESKNLVEEDDDEDGLDHDWLVRDQSTSDNLHFHYQEVLFSSLEIEVIIPPPKA